MKKYVCTVCGYIYDEAAGDPDNGVEPGTKWRMFPKTGSALFAAWAKISLKKPDF